MPPTTGRLRRLLSQRLNDEELRNLCQDLQVDYDDLLGQGKTAKIRELIAHLERRDRLGDIITCLKESRPDLQRELQTVSQPPTSPVGRAIVILTIVIIGAIATWLIFSSLSPTNTPTPTPTPTNTPTPTPTPTNTPTPTPLCGPAVTVDDIPYIAPEMAGGSPFGIIAKKSCGIRRPDKAYGVELSVHSGSTPQWGISSPGVSDLSNRGVVSFWLIGSEGGEALIFGITDTNNQFAKYEISASSEWVNVIIPLAEFRNKGIDLHKVQNIFIDFEGSVDAAVYVDEITFVPIPTWEFRGVNLTAFSRDAYESPEAKALVEHFKQIGANYVSVLVTWYQDGQQAIEVAPDPNKTPSDESLEEIIGYVHSQDMKVLLNLHVDDQHMDLDYPSVERWRGNFDPANPAQWFNSYREFVTHYAKLAQVHQVGVINIGSEQVSLESPQENVRRWIEIAQAAREIYTGKLMYTMGRRSGLDEQQREEDLALLWKELDYVGTTVHYTLSEESTPPMESLVESWESCKDDLSNWENTIQKPIVFTEVAYRSVDYCTREPWRWRGPLGPDQTGEGGNLTCQQNAHEAFLQVFGQETWVTGAFWWHYDPGSPSEYSLKNKLADGVVNRWYGGLPTETTLQSPIPPAPTQVNYDLEAPAIMWVRPELSSLTTTAVASKNRPDMDDWVLEWTVSLAGADEHRRQGEALLDLRYSRLLDNGLTEATRPFSYNMRDKCITCWIYAPEASAGLTIQAFAKSIDDSNWWSEYGNPVAVKENEWFKVTLIPDTLSDTSGDGDSDDVDLDFDPESVVAIGLKIMASDDAAYDGTLYVDACSWREN